MKNIGTGLVRLIILGSIFCVSLQSKIIPGGSQRLQQVSKNVADWTLLVYMEASNNLNPFAITNLNDMARVGSVPGKLNILVQWHQPNKKGGWRYQINKRKIKLIEHVESAHQGDCVKDLTQAATWAFNNYPAKQYGIILWDHGVGIVDPLWGRMRSSIPQGDVSFAHRQEALESNDTIDSQCRGILFDETSKTYMNNQHMVDALSYIKSKILKGKKLDFLGMDACLMAMTEVAYQVRSYADVLVGSQEVEYAQGWAYSMLLADLATKSVSSVELAENVVSSYDLYYKRKNHVYTQSAIDLNYIHYLKQNIDQVVSQIKLCTKEHGMSMKGLVQEARRNCLHFNTPSYVDLHSFYTELHKLVSKSSLKTVHYNDVCVDEACFNGKDCGLEIAETILPENYYYEHITRGGLQEDRISLPSAVRPKSTHIENLKEHLVFGMRLIESIVFSSVSSKDLDRARGISIYYPRYRIDKSYLKTQFAKDSLWLEFLRENS